MRMPQTHLHASFSFKPFDQLCLSRKLWQNPFDGNFNVQIHIQSFEDNSHASADRFAQLTVPSGDRKRGYRI